MVAGAASLAPPILFSNIEGDTPVCEFSPSRWLRCCSVCRLARAADTPVNRPNILWLVADDLSPELGCYGDPLSKTPNLDRLAADGVRFNNAFTTAPVCSASRSAFFTGMYQTTIGGHNHRTRGKFLKPLPEGVKLVMDRFRQAGYFTTTVANKQLGSNAKTDYNFIYKQPFDGNDWRDRKPGQPFFAYINFKEPHRAFVKPSQAPQPVDPDKVKLPPYYPDVPVAREDWAAYLNSIEVLDAKIGRALERLKQDGLAENTVVFFFGDHGRPHVRGKQFLYDGGIHVPLIVRWLGNQKVAPAGAVNDDLVSAIDIPATSLKLAGVDLPANMQGQVFLGPEAQKRDVVFAARDRCDGTVDRIRCVRDKQFKYIRNFMPERPYTQLNSYKERSYPVLPLMRRLAEQGKLTPAQARFMSQETRPLEELYDLRTDPHEIHNLADDPKFAETLKKYRARLDRWIEETHDQGQQPEDPASVAQEYNDMLRRHKEYLSKQRKQK